MGAIGKSSTYYCSDYGVDEAVTSPLKGLQLGHRNVTSLDDYDDGAVPIDKNQVENQKRPWALGRSNWLVAGSLRRIGKRAAAIMSLIQSARMNGHNPYAYLKDVLTRCRHSGPVRSGNCCRISGYRPDLRMVSCPDAYRQPLFKPKQAGTGMRPANTPS